MARTARAGATRQAHTQRMISLVFLACVFLLFCLSLNHCLAKNFGLCTFHYFSSVCKGGVMADIRLEDNREMTWGYFHFFTFKFRKKIGKSQNINTKKRLFFPEILIF